jgi:hypothetical protein
VVSVQFPYSAILQWALPSFIWLLNFMTWFCFVLFFSFTVLGIMPRALSMLTQVCTTEIHPGLTSCFWHKISSTSFIKFIADFLELFSYILDVYMKLGKYILDCFGNWEVLKYSTLPLPYYFLIKII